MRWSSFLSTLSLTAPQSTFRAVALKDKVFAAVAIGISVMPPLYFAYLIATTCSNSLTNDYFNFVPLIDDLVSGNYHWQRLFSDLFYAGHFILIPVLWCYTNATLFHWAPELDLFLGWLIALLKVLVLFLCTKGKDNASEKWKFLIILSLIIFGGSQASVYLYGMTSMCWGLSTFAFTCGIWSLLSCRSATTGVWLMMLAGIVSSFTEGNVPPCWLAFLLVLTMSGPRPRWHLGVWSAGLAISLLPYAIGFVLKKHSGTLTTSSSSIHLEAVADLLGRIFLNHSATTGGYSQTSQVFGLLGLSFFLIYLYIIRKRILSSPPPSIITALALGLYGLSSAVLLSLVRTTIAPWYVALTSPFWIGLLIIATNCLSSSDEPNQLSDNSVASINKPALRLFGLFTCIVFAGLYVNSNFRIRDKDWFRRSHCPSSEAVLRNFRRFPTYCIENLTSGELPQYEQTANIAYILNRNSWAAGRPEQTWALQGDYVFPWVQIQQNQSADNEQVGWLRDHNIAHTEQFSAPEHLNLFVPARARLNWLIDIPAKCHTAFFATAYTTIDATSKTSAPPIKVTADGQEVQLMVTGNKISCDLQKQSGKSIAISFGCDNTKSIFDYPLLKVLRNGPDRDKRHLRPANVDALPDMKPKEISKLQMNFSDTDLWHFTDIEPIKNQADKSSTVNLSTFKILGAAPSLFYKPSVNVRLKECRYCKIEMSVPTDISPRIACLQLTLNGNELTQFRIPLLQDGQLHHYSYDMKLLPVKAMDRITALTILPLYINSNATGKEIKLGKLSFTGAD